MRSAFFLILVTVFIGCTSKERNQIILSKDQLKEFYFIDKMKGSENLYLYNNSLDLLVTDLSGHISKISGNSLHNLQVVKSVKLNFYTLGVVSGANRKVYVLTNNKNWPRLGGELISLDSNFKNQASIKKDISGVNGMTIDKDSNIYFVTGNMSLYKPRGSIYKLEYKNGTYKEPQIFQDSLKSPNGLFYSDKENKLIFTEVFRGVKSISLKDKKIQSIFGKSQTVEGFDDLCMDSKGNYWVADPPFGFIKMYNPISQKIYRFELREFGVASSCKVRFHESKEYIYITEMRKSKWSLGFDGRGVIVLPLEELMRFIN